MPHAAHLTAETAPAPFPATHASRIASALSWAMQMRRAIEAAGRRGERVTHPLLLRLMAQADASLAA
jgi:hypothetical protein